MKIIVGLGNPGKQFLNTKHNAGFLFLNALREKFLYQEGIHVTDWRVEDAFQSEISFLKEGTKIIAVFVKPQTFMNNSGEAVAKIVKKLEIEELRENMILVHDDLDIPLGEYKIQQGKAPSGHNGVNSVEDRLGTNDFKRVRIGIENRENRNIPGEDYVVTKFSKDEKVIIDEAIQKAIQGILFDIIL
jgi:peptidyl-tRNA hydrolase, PTH1 family